MLSWLRPFIVIEQFIKRRSSRKGRADQHALPYSGDFFSRYRRRSYAARSGGVHGPAGSGGVGVPARRSDVTPRAGRFLLGAACVAAATAASAEVLAQQPQSAIPWLSESVDSSAGSTLPLPQPSGFGIEPVTTTLLEGSSQDAVGVLPSDVTGFSPQLWGPTPYDEVRDLILTHSTSGTSSGLDLFRRILLAQSTPPEGGDGTSAILLARVDKLLAMGALEEAEALLELAGPDTPNLFRRWFDTALLTDTADAPCDALKRNPALSPTLPTRVFCLARAGDWNAAEITLTLGREVGSIDPRQEALLARFLDPELFEGVEEPPVEEPLTPLNYLIRESVGLSRPRTNLPLAFLHHDLSEHAPMRTRIEAAERLVKAGSLPETVLFDAYRSGTPSASGGPWDRASAVQELDDAMFTQDAADLSAAVLRADMLMTARGLRTAFAKDFGARWSQIDGTVLDPEATETAFDLLLLAGMPGDAATLMQTPQDDRQQALLTIAGVGTASPTIDNAMLASVLGAFSDPPPATGSMGESQLDLLKRGEQGKALLTALEMLSDGPDGAPAATAAALFTLVQAGQETAARRIALEVLLSGGQQF